MTPARTALKPAVLAAAGYAVAAIVWVASGAELPGGRWFGVHVFTLGMLSNLIVALAPHFAATVLHARERGGTRGRFLLLNGGVLAMLGFPPGVDVAFIGGVVAVVSSVGWMYADLRWMRKRSLGGRYAFVVHRYENACLAFIAAATVGALLRLGVLPGTWAWGARLAHLHLNVLGWGGLTLLGTVVFFGPTVMRTEAEPAAAQAAARALRNAAMGLAVAAAALLVSGVGGDFEMAGRAVASLALVLYAWGATRTLLPVVRAGSRAQPSIQTWLMVSACVWFVLTVWADVFVVGADRIRLFDALGAVLLVGVLAQAILAALTHLVPVVWGRTDGRSARHEILARTRALAFNLGVAMVGAAAVAGRGADVPGAVAARSGWVLVSAGALSQLALVLLPAVRRSGPGAPPSEGRS